jgi:hypothetical protein
MLFGLKFSRTEDNKFRSHWSKFSNSNAYESLRDRYWCEVEGKLIAKLCRDKYPVGLNFTSSRHVSHTLSPSHIDLVDVVLGKAQISLDTVTCTYSHLRALCCYTIRMKHTESCMLLSHSQLGFCS